MDLQEHLQQKVSLFLKGEGVADYQSVARRLARYLWQSEIPFTPKMARKVRQQYNRKAGEMYDNYGNQLRNKLETLNNILKPRPKYMPKNAWSWLAQFFIDVEKIERPITSGNEK